MRRILIFVLTICLFTSVFAQFDSPKRELRAAWISTVVNIDWPNSRTASTQSQKDALINILDYLKEANINAVVFQVRPACDAMYQSKYEPWSYWLTGKQGKAPSPFYDPLKFAVEEAHKRGMELHAWFNPYRVDKKYGMTLAENNPAVQHPDWVLTIDGNKILNPGLPEVREHVKNVIMDVVTRYDVDAVHFDDYFYLEGITTQDDDTYKNYKRGFTSKAGWRRDNVHELIRALYSSIQETKPHVKLGMSPFGIWRPGQGGPAGIVGWDVYNTIYCDAITWLDEQIIDYLAPQLYWKFGGGQDYSTLARWWALQRNGRHIYPGLAFYRVGQSTFDKTQLGKMIKLNRTTMGVEGQVFFTANDFKTNAEGNTDTLKNNYFKYKALLPQMDWKDNVAPQAPANLAFGRVEGLGTTGITWKKPSDEDIARYALYMFDDTNIDLTDPTKIVDVTSDNYFVVDERFSNETKNYVVTALDHNNNESVNSAVFTFQPAIAAPSTPSLISPSIAAENIGDTVLLKWNYAEHAVSYNLQIALNESFNISFLRKDGIVDTSFAVTGMDGEQTYYWRVRAENSAGESEYSDIYSFTTGFPAAPSLVYPTDVTTDVELNPTFMWTAKDGITEYGFQLYEGLSTSGNFLVIDTTLADTTFSVSDLKTDQLYNWRVYAKNDLGKGNWADVFKFKTGTATDVESSNDVVTEFRLKQNYPNPFNPSTTIEYSVSEVTTVKLQIYDMLGREVKILVNETQSAGNYSVVFDASNLASGMYIYKLQAGQYNSTKKLILLK
ncbi:MAG: family 10 glycosylhydrolase [Melioribacteraceae bacterium]|nr:family 10 glycosylhydrolase [Melioribacteraceae bacterium]